MNRECFDIIIPFVVEGNAIKTILCSQTIRFDRIFKMYLVYLSYGLIGKIDLFWGFHDELFDKMSKLFVVIFDMCTNKIREGVKICNCNLYFEKSKRCLVFKHHAPAGLGT